MLESITPTVTAVADRPVLQSGKKSAGFLRTKIPRRGRNNAAPCKIKLFVAGVPGNLVQPSRYNGTDVKCSQCSIAAFTN